VGHKPAAVSSSGYFRFCAVAGACSAIAAY
jgi:hypothetical protein